MEPIIGIRVVNMSPKGGPSAARSWPSKILLNMMFAPIIPNFRETI